MPRDLRFVPLAPKINSARLMLLARSENGDVDAASHSARGVGARREAWRR